MESPNAKIAVTFSQTVDSSPPADVDVGLKMNKKMMKKKRR